MTGGPVRAVPHDVPLADGFTVTDDAALLDLVVVHEALSRAYWFTGHAREGTVRAFAHSMAFAILAPDGATVGFGRLVTDRTFRAHLADVMVLPAVRGRGFGRALVEAMLGHPDLATVTKWTLTTADAHGLYARYGFRPSAGDPKWMVLDRA